jgi:predicted RNA-binding protein
MVSDLLNSNMQPAFSDNNQVRVVTTFSELVNTTFQGEINAICWNRDLLGDFKEIVSKLELKENITEVSTEDLLALQLSEKGILARDIILNDIQLLTDFGASPSLNLLKHYERDQDLDFISTDVYSYHVDRSPIETDTFLCTYHGAASDIISNDQVEQKILIPEIREKLKALHDGPETEFETFLQEYFFDLHYQPKPNSEPVNLGSGQLWRLAVDHPTQQVLPCVHRAPVEKDGEYRLLLIC